MYNLLIYTIVLLLLQGCISKDQDMYAQQSYQNLQTRSKVKGKAFRETVAPATNIVGGVIVGTIQGVGEVAKYTANHPELVEQGIKTYQQVEYEQRMDQQRAYKASSDLRKITDNSSSSQHNHTSIATGTNNSDGLQYSYTKSSTTPVKEQLRECTTYRVDKWIEDEGKLRNPTYANFYKNRQIGSRISCDHLAKCSLFKISYKDYTHTIAHSNRIKHLRVNYAVIKRVQLLEPSDICYTNCAAGVCNSLAKVDAYIDRNFYNKTFHGGTSIQQ